jgi:hypothetical protein
VTEQRASHDTPSAQINAPAPGNNFSRDGYQDEARRIWEHGLHEDNGLLQRGNFFLIAESLLLVAFSSLLSSSTASGAAHALTVHMLLAARVVASFGLFLTAAWIYVGHRHLKYCRFIGARAVEYFPEYKATRDAWRRGLVPTMSVITYIIPSLGGILWIVLLFIA